MIKIKKIQTPNTECYYKHLCYYFKLPKKNTKVVLKIYEKLGLFYDVIQYYMDSSDYDSIVRECKNLTENIKNPLDLEANEGDIDSHMYVKVLEYFVSECKGLNSETEAYKKVIGYIEIVINSIKEKKNIIPC